MVGVKRKRHDGPSYFLLKAHALDLRLRRRRGGHETHIVPTPTLTKPVEKPVMSLEQTLSLLEAITDLQDLCLMHVGIFSGPRVSEVMGFQWKSWTGAAWYSLRGAVLQGAVQVEGEQSTYIIPCNRPIAKAKAAKSPQDAT